MSWQMLANLHHFKWQMKEITVGKAVSRTLLSMHLFTHKPLFHRKPGLNSSVRKLRLLLVVFVDYARLGCEIRRRRKQKCLSQEKLGELVGLSQKQISRIENYGTDSLWKLKWIADVFEVKVMLS
jgi:DNA-binding XRE family transcriptional regulator